MSKKIKKYERETKSMPFLSRLIQDEVLVASYSFIHSWSTSLGMSIYEQLAEMIVEGNTEAIRQLRIKEGIDEKRITEIRRIINELKNGRQPDKIQESTEVLNIPNSNPQKIHNKGSIVDFYMKREGKEYYFEIKTVKPNTGEVWIAKQKLLEWVARKNVLLNSIVALPYNPDPSKEYQRFTSNNIFDKKELWVAEQFWDFLGGPGTYEQLLEIFDKVGKNFKVELQKKIKDISKDISKV